MMRRWPILLGFLLAVSANAAGAEKHKYTVCTVTINSSDEANLFKEKLNSSQFDFVELVPDQNSSPGKSDENWFESACAKFKADGTKCDLLIISGHFGGTFFGSSGKRLSIETLEQMGCNDACPGIMNSPKEVFLFGCNTLAGKAGDTRTPDQYRAVLRGEVNEQGDRVFTDAQVGEIVAFRYSDFGQSNRDRMSRAFSGVSHLYGFDSVAPLGKNAKASINNYLTAVPNYAKHVEQVELEESVKKVNEGLEKVGAMNNPTIAKAFKSTNFAQCSGEFTEDSSGYCKIFDKSKPLAYRIGALRTLLTGPDGAKYLATAKQFFEKNPPTSYDAEAKAEFDQIAQNPVVRERFENTLKAMGGMPEFAYDLVDIGQKLSFLSTDQANTKKGEILTALINKGSVGAKDFVCSRSNWPQISASSLSASAFQNANSLYAISCLNAGLSDTNALSTKLAQSLKSSDSDVRRLGAWLMGTFSDPSPQSRSALMGLLSDKDTRVKQMAAWTLHQTGATDPSVQEVFVNHLADPNEDATVRRDAAMGLFQAASQGQISPSLRVKIESLSQDKDEIVSKIIKRLLVLSSPQTTRRPASPPNWTSVTGANSVTTRAGVQFEKVKSQDGLIGWRDTNTKKVWTLVNRKDVNQYQAEIECSKPGLSLPSKSDFAVAEQHGIREAFQGLRDHWFWSSSARPYDADFAHVLNRSNGDVVNFFRDVSNFSNAVVCVGR